jgi:SAM-dependent methyltransferase
LSNNEVRPHDASSRIADALRRGVLVDDRIFDEVYPHVVRRASHVHWTPVEAAVRAARLLVEKPGARLLDVGSGVGKFCIVAAATVDARVCGIEHRAHLVEIAERAAARIGVDVCFDHRALDRHDAADVDGIYLFNPFAENLCATPDRIDGTVELSAARFTRDLEIFHEILHGARVGTRVVTYCGFGGELPRTYVRVLRERRVGVIELWVKTGRISR